MNEQKLLARKRKATTDKNQALLISTCTDLAELYINQSRYEKAIEEYSLLATIYKKEKQYLNYAQVNRGIGEAFMSLKEFERALQYEHIYLAFSKQERNKVEIQRAWATIGNTYLNWYLHESLPSNKKYLNEANKYFKKSLELSEELTGIGKYAQADMKARLLANLGLIEENLNNNERALELLQKSIDLCKNNDVYEQLYRGYISIAMLYEKLNQFNESIKNMDLAIETAKKLKSQIDLMCGALLYKSEIMNKLGNYLTSKKVLLKAYKLKTPNLEEQRIIEENLRSVTILCKIEDRLRNTPDSDPKLKKLYERMGDNACKLKLYEQAIKFYNLMKETSEKCGENTADLSTYYFSLGETYQDWGKYNEALENFEKDYQLSRSKLKDALNSLSKIADIKECLNADFAEMKSVYSLAFQHCREENNRKEEIRMIRRYLEYLEKNNCTEEKFKMMEALSNLTTDGDTDSSSDFESIEDEFSFDNIPLDELLSDESQYSSDETAPVTTERPKRLNRGRNFTLKTNQKGESQLHRACIKGELQEVRLLVEQGHRLDVRDNSGWQPLHEACNYGHLKIVEFLVEKGAPINDRGGKLCNGITPLHDASSNGHLDVVKLLLDKGASSLLKDNDGETPLSYLLKWGSSEDEIEEETLYKELIERMSKDLEKIGEPVRRTPVKRDSCERFRSSRIGLARRNVRVESSDEENDTGNEEYRHVMDSLRNARRKEQVRRVSNEKQSALILEEDFVDDYWLDDDLGSTKKRKANKWEDVENKKSRLSVESIEEEPMYDSDVEFSNLTPLRERAVKTVKKRKQSSLLSAGFTHFRQGSSQRSIKSNASQIVNKSQQQSKLSLIRHNSNSSNSEDIVPTVKINERIIENLNSDPTLHVDVCIEGKTYRVPLLLSQIKTHTIKWLAEEAANRYASKWYSKPTLEFETKNGAVLSNSDLINVLFPFDAIESEVVTGKVIKFDLPPLVKRYKDISKEMNRDTEENLCRLLEEMTVKLDMNNLGVIGGDLEPLCRALCHQSTLIELDLSGNFLSTKCVEFLGNSLSTLSSLLVLNLNCTNLQAEHLAVLRNCMPGKLNELNLGDNYLMGDCVEYLVEICGSGQLKKLNLSNAGLTGRMFEDCELNLSNIEELDISDNDLDVNAIVRIVSFTSLPKLRALNVCNNKAKNVLGRIVALYDTKQCKCELRRVEMSRCGVQDSGIFNLLKIAGEHLEIINFSYNPELTGVSLQLLLESPTVKNINLIGCTSIMKYFPGRPLQEGNQSRLELLRMHMDWNENHLTTINSYFRSKFTAIKSFTNYLCVQITK